MALTALEDRRQLAAPKASTRSRIANGKLPEGIDGRSSWGRRYRELITSLSSDIDEEAAGSESLRSLVMRAAALTVETERLEAKLSTLTTPDPALIDLHGRTAGNLRRLLAELGAIPSKTDTPPPATSDALSESDVRRVWFALNSEKVIEAQ